MGPNPLGFMSALYSVGSIATVAALWPVDDGPAVGLAKHLAQQIKAHFVKIPSGAEAIYKTDFHATNFPRARALSKAIRNAVEDGPWDIWDFAPYALWGLP